MCNWWKNWNPKLNEQGNQSGRGEIKTSSHAQRIGIETLIREYNMPTSHRHLEQMERYAELMGNYKN